MVSWERLDEDFKRYVERFSTRHDYEKSSILDRAKLYHTYLVSKKGVTKNVVTNDAIRSGAGDDKISRRRPDVTVDEKSSILERAKLYHTYLVSKKGVTKNDVTNDVIRSGAGDDKIRRRRPDVTVDEKSSILDRAKLYHTYLVSKKGVTKNDVTNDAIGSGAGDDKIRRRRPDVTVDRRTLSGDIVVDSATTNKINYCERRVTIMIPPDASLSTDDDQTEPKESAGIRNGDNDQRIDQLRILEEVSSTSSFLTKATDAQSIDACNSSPPTSLPRDARSEKDYPGHSLRSLLEDVRLPTTMSRLRGRVKDYWLPKPISVPGYSTNVRTWSDRKPNQTNRSFVPYFIDDLEYSEDGEDSLVSTSISSGSGSSPSEIQKTTWWQI